VINIKHQKGILTINAKREIEQSENANPVKKAHENGMTKKVKLIVASTNLQKCAVKAHKTRLKNGQIHRKMV